MRTRRSFCHRLLLLTASLLLAACSRTEEAWHADVTEWITGLPMDNVCALACPMRLESAVDSSGNTFVSGFILSPTSDSADLPAGTRYELIHADLKHEQGATGYTLYVDLLRPDTGEKVGLIFQLQDKQAELPYLVAPADGKPLRLSLKDALQYAEKKSLPR